jgi:acyl-CoA synthetase (AMP-forming)/AMP-acid ligase II
VIPSKPIPPGTNGVLFPGVEARLIDAETLQDVKEGESGELVIRGSVVFREFVDI